MLLGAHAPGWNTVSFRYVHHVNILGMYILGMYEVYMTLGMHFQGIYIVYIPRIYMFNRMHTDPVYI